MARRRTTRPAPAQSLLVELLTEELPPKSLRAFASAFDAGLFRALDQAGLIADAAAARRVFATPRRLAVLIPGVLARAPDTQERQLGPPVSAGPQAAQGFARKHGLAPEALTREQSPKGEVFVASYTRAGAVLAEVLAEQVEAALKSLPVPKLMRWGAGEAQFARPVHGLVMLHGAKLIAGTILGQRSGRHTRGHRFLSKGALAIGKADAYATVLEQRGRVIADFDRRRARIEQALDRAAGRLGRGANWRIDGADAVLDEVTGIVEWPQVQSGGFDRDFLAVPRECLVVSMQQQQRYFPVADAAGRLLPLFLFVANVPAAAGSAVVRGNERVLRARLADAKFFYEQDLKSTLESRVLQLAGVVFHNKLGSQLERVERIGRLTVHVAGLLGTDAVAGARAARLAKADLQSGMVGEFPELQGIMGRYYALHDGEAEIVADAIAAHYRPRFAGDAVPQQPVAVALALADKLDTLAGMFGILQTPTGDKDPFGMRRAALGVVRILIERDLPLSLHDLVKAAFAGYQGRVGEARDFLETFIYERLAGWCRERGYSTLEIDAVVSLRPALIHLVPRLLEAVRAFGALPEAASLVAANKRVANILKQAATQDTGAVDPALLGEPAERRLFDALQAAAERGARLSAAGDFTGCLKNLAVLRAPVDEFFDRVMVMAEDEALRRNRLALLAGLRAEMNRLADIARLSA